MKNKLKLLTFLLLSIFLMACVGADEATSAVIDSASNFGEAETSKDSSKDDSVDEVVRWVDEELDGYFDVHYDSKIHAVVLFPNTEAMKDDYYLVLSDVNEPDKWVDLFESVKGLSQTVSSRADDESLATSIIDPMGDDYMIYVAVNGKEDYNGFKRIGLY